jgi:hypothetical protein
VTAVLSVMLVLLPGGYLDDVSAQAARLVEIVNGGPLTSQASAMAAGSDAMPSMVAHASR